MLGQGGGGGRVLGGRRGGSRRREHMAVGVEFSRRKRTPKKLIVTCDAATHQITWHPVSDRSAFLLSQEHRLVIWVSQRPALIVIPQDVCDEKKSKLIINIFCFSGFGLT